jgi:hypothetical protein
MNRFVVLHRIAMNHRPLVKLALLAVGLLALGAGIGAPECLPDPGC